MVIAPLPVLTNDAGVVGSHILFKTVYYHIEQHMLARMVVQSITCTGTRGLSIVQ